jgi:hypothetical protein
MYEGQKHIVNSTNKTIDKIWHDFIIKSQLGIKGMRIIVIYESLQLMSYLMVKSWKVSFWVQEPKRKAWCPHVDSTQHWKIYTDQLGKKKE